MAAISAGLLVYRMQGSIEVLIVHPGGPFWKNKREGVWSIPKGEFDPASEDPLDAALREYAEEIGHPAPGGDPIPLGEVTQRAGKRVVAWAVEGDLDPTTVASNTFDIEWPPKSGRTASFPEVDRAAWFPIHDARTLINPAQVAFLERLDAHLTGS